MRKHVLISALLWFCVMAPGAFAELISIGNRKQLFWDDYLIENMKDTDFMLNPAIKTPDNPVIQRDRPWEGNYLHCQTVFYDEDQQQFRMWYGSANYKPHPTKRWETSNNYNCYAVSKDGYHWEKPSLGFAEYEGSKENNILAPDNWPGFKGGIIRDVHETDPAKRYKAIAQTIDSSDPTSTSAPGMKFNLYYSPDAFHWTPYEKNPVIDWGQRKGRWGPTALMGWDPIRQVYAAHMEVRRHRRGPLGKRMIGRAESPDMTSWSPSEPIIVPDSKDFPDTEFYSLWAAPYESFTIGMLWIFRTTNTSILPEFVFSRDGIHYDRRFRQPFILPSSAPQFDSVVIYALQPIVHDQNIFIYYSGCNWRDEELLEEVGEKNADGAIGLATIPLDGFISLEGASAKYSEVVTRAFTFSGKNLQVNMQVGYRGQNRKGEVKVEILEADYFPIPGYTFEDADALTTTGPVNLVSWKGQSDVSQLAGRPVKLRFYFKHAKLFSFQFVE